MSNTANIKEIFTSIQGEGLYVGVKQLFIRFSGCNLTCKYCDTEHIKDTTCYTPAALAEFINKMDIESIHSISFTGGEPLLYANFLKDFLPLCKHKIYLETNGTLIEPFYEMAGYIDIAAIDIKINSISNQGILFKTHDKFIEIAIKNSIETFAKVVFDENITEEEIVQTCKICEKNNIPLILQPKMENNHIFASGVLLTAIFDKFLLHYKNVRLIPQTHKFINVE